MLLKAKSRMRPLKFLRKRIPVETTVPPPRRFKFRRQPPVVGAGAEERLENAALAEVVNRPRVARQQVIILAAIKDLLVHATPL